jgi:hypothetical protein
MELIQGSWELLFTFLAVIMIAGFITWLAMALVKYVKGII